MLDIRLYLERYKALGTDFAASRQLVAEIASELSGAKILESEIDIRKGGDIRIKVSGSRKTALFIARHAIEAKLKERLGKTNEIR